MKQLAYTKTGNGKAVILLHGFLENKQMWNFLTTDSYQYISIDLPGHGDSENESDVHTMDFMAEKVLQILQSENITKAHFIGHSMGGYVALALAEKNPEVIHSLTLFFSSPFEDSYTKKVQRARAAVLASKNPKEFIRLGIPNLFQFEKLDELQPEITYAKKMASTTSVKGMSAALLGMKDRKNLSLVLQQNTFPILWVYGEYDNAVSYKKVEEMGDNTPKIRTKKLKIGHMGHLEAPEECNQIIHKFLQSQ